MTTTKMSFGIDMEFICNTARDWFWKEGRPISKCLELLYSIMEVNDQTRLDCYLQAINIIEGRKIIVGRNEGKLIDDNENVRPLSDMLEKQYAKIMKYELANNIRANPSFYVDTYVGGYSMRMYDDFPDTIESVTRYRLQGSKEDEDSFQDIDEHPLQYGLAFLYDTDFAYKVLGEVHYDKETIFEKLHLYYNEMLSDWKNDGLVYLHMNDYQQAVYHRNIASALVYTNNPHPYFLNQGEVNYDFIMSDKENELYSPAPTSLLDEDYRFDGYCDRPGEYYSPYALISPEGIYYSSGFGGHQIKATAIVNHHKILAEEYEAFKLNQPVDQQAPDFLLSVSEKLSVDFLVTKGWMILKDHYYTGRVSLPKVHSITQVQMDQINNMVVYLQLDYHPVTCRSIDWEEFDI